MHAVHVCQIKQCIQLSWICSWCSFHRLSDRNMKTAYTRRHGHFLWSVTHPIYGHTDSEINVYSCWIRKHIQRSSINSTELSRIIVVKNCDKNGVGRLLNQPMAWKHMFYYLIRSFTGRTVICVTSHLRPGRRKDVWKDCLNIVFDHICSVPRMGLMLENCNITQNFA